MAVLTVWGEWRKQTRAQASIFSSAVDFEQDLRKKKNSQSLDFLICKVESAPPLPQGFSNDAHGRQQCMHTTQS